MTVIEHFVALTLKTHLAVNGGVKTQHKTFNTMHSIMKHMTVLTKVASDSVSFGFVSRFTTAVRTIHRWLACL